MTRNAALPWEMILTQTAQIQAINTQAFSMPPNQDTHMLERQEDNATNNQEDNTNQTQHMQWQSDTPQVSDQNLLRNSHMQQHTDQPIPQQPQQVVGTTVTNLADQQKHTVQSTAQDEDNNNAAQSRASGEGNPRATSPDLLCCSRSDGIGDSEAAGGSVGGVPRGMPRLVIDLNTQQAPTPASSAPREP